MRTPPTYGLTESGRDWLSSRFDLVLSNPYSEYVSFRNEVESIISDPEFPKELMDYTSKGHEIYCLRGCPVSLSGPPTGSTLKDQSISWRNRPSFREECFLELVSQLSGQPILGYSTRNSGDFFQHVLPSLAYYGTQTQKTEGNLAPHNDRTAHRMRADSLCLLGANVPEDNLIATLYWPGSELIVALSEEERSILRSRIFETPFDLLSRDSNTTQLKSESHSIICENGELRYYSGRTRPCSGAGGKAERAIASLEEKLADLQPYSFVIQQGDLLVLPNKAGLHSRKVVKLNSAGGLGARWLIKTYNLSDRSVINSYQDNFSTDGTALFFD